ncbi:MAG: hypothetical protein FJW14_04505 [Acidimicrobiia bacterium]|nr:hypothetical protein [Acidimicrobiia bacterium]
MRKVYSLVAVLAVAAPPALSAVDGLAAQAPAQQQPAQPQGGRGLGALGQAVRRPPPPTTPTPRLPDGTVDLSGLWVGGGTDGDIETGGGLKLGEIPVLPWVKEYMAKVDPTADPSSYCLPMGIPRKAPYPWRFVSDPAPGRAAQRIFVIEEGNIHSYRQIFMNGKHPDESVLVPTWFGHSVGRWEGDTLVIETIGFNGKVWMDRRGFPQTERASVTERFTRTNMGTLERVVTIDDPGAYSKPWTVRFTARLSNPGDELIEYICNENNQYGGAGGFGAPREFPVIGPPATR